MNIFSKMERHIPREPWEKFGCPFCAVFYTSLLEVRPIDCAACGGIGARAQAADEEVHNIFEGLRHLPRNTSTLNLVEEYVRKLGPGYYRSEYRTFWRELKGELEEVQCTR